MSIRLLGLDIGQTNDYAALVILEAEGTKYTVEGDTGPVEFETLPLKRLDVRHIERFQLGTKYHDVAAKVGDRTIKVPKPAFLVVDQTGVGAAAIEMLTSFDPIGIMITAGGQAHWEGKTINVPKRDLVASLQVALQTGLLRIAKALPNALILTGELTNFRAKVSLAGHDTYEAWREKDHDDLVLALALAVWLAAEIFRMALATAQGMLDAQRADAILRDSQISEY